MTDKKPLLMIEDLHASVEGNEILRGVDLVVREGELHALMGPNGVAYSRPASVVAMPTRTILFLNAPAGTRPARFATFVRGPRAIAAWLRSGSPQGASHNPLGALSVLAMLALLLAQALTGLFANDEIASAGPFYGWVSHGLSNRLSRFHRANDAWLLALIGLHLAAVAWYTIVRRQQIVRGMITGDPAAGGGAGVLGGDSLLLRAALIEAGGNQAQVAKRLGMARGTVIEKLRKHGLK